MDKVDDKSPPTPERDGSERGGSIASTAVDQSRLGKQTKYPGSGTQDDPYLVSHVPFLTADISQTTPLNTYTRLHQVDFDGPQDLNNPKNWPRWKKWLMTLQIASLTFCISLASSIYAGGLGYTKADLHMSETVAELGLSLFVLGELSKKNI